MNEENIKRVLAVKLKELREEKGLSQTQLAEKLGVSRGSVSFYENSERMAGIDFIYKAANFFGCSSDYLLGLTEHKNKENEKQFNIAVEAQNIIYNELTAHYKTSFAELIKYVLSVFLLTQDNEFEDNRECFEKYVEFVSYFSAFYCTRHGMYAPEYFEDKKPSSAVRIITAFELIDMIDKHVRDFLNIEAESLMDKQFTEDYHKFQTWWEKHLKGR